MSTLPYPDEFACAIGHVVLTFNALDEAVSDLILELENRVHDWNRSSEVAAEYFVTKLTMLRGLLAQLTDISLAKKIESQISLAEVLNKERVAFAHGVLWFNLEERRLQKRMVRQPRKKDGEREPVVEHDNRSPREILEIAMKMEDLRGDISATAYLMSPKREDENFT